MTRLHILIPREIPGHAASFQARNMLLLLLHRGYHFGLADLAKNALDIDSE